MRIASAYRTVKDLLMAEHMETYKVKLAGSLTNIHFRENATTIEEGSQRDLSRIKRHGLLGLHRCYRVMDILQNICIECAKPPPLTVFTQKGK